MGYREISFTNTVVASPPTATPPEGIEVNAMGRPESVVGDSVLPAKVTALVPLRSLGDKSKTRLRDVLSASERAVLSAAMLTDVVAALHGADVTAIVVLAGDDSAKRIGRELGLNVLRDQDPSTGLNGAIRPALAPHSDTLLVMPDLPMLTAEDVTALLTTRATVAIAPSADGGTGGLFQRRGVRLPPAFGPGSASAHASGCLALKATLECRDLLGFSVDIDTPNDLTELVPERLGPATARLVQHPTFARLLPAVSPSARW